VQIKGIVLKHHGNVAVLGRNVVNPFAVDKNVAGGNLLKAGHQAQRRGFTAAGRTDQYDKFLVINSQVGIFDRDHSAGIDFVDIFQNNICHGASLAGRNRPMVKCGLNADVNDVAT
jgi:hypothetical protein